MGTRKLSVIIIIIITADTLLYAVTLTFNLEHLQCITCDVIKLCS